MAISQNGWTVQTSGTSANLVAIPKIIGRVRKGNVATIFTDLVEYFDTHIEDVDKGRDDWGYAYRAIRGADSGYSNHASGTAIDINATKHPLGAVNTFTATQIAAIQKMLKRYEGTVRWGGNYPGRKDEMHFEINASAAEVRRVAEKLSNNPVDIIPAGSVTPSKPAQSVKPVVDKSSADTKGIQKYLRNVTGDYKGAVDGVYGPRTATAVKAYQRRQNQYGRFRLAVDGDWGPKLQKHMEWVKKLQTAVSKWKASQRVGHLPIDGDYGHKSFTHVKRLQVVNGKPGGAYHRAGGRVADGQPGPVTCKMLGIPNHP